MACPTSAAYDKSGLFVEYGPGGSVYGSWSYSSSGGAGPIGPGDETRFTAQEGEEGGEKGGGDDRGNGDLNTFLWVRLAWGVTGRVEVEASTSWLEGA